MENPERQFNELIIKLRNLQVLLEVSVLRGAHDKARYLIDEISDITNQIEDIRKIDGDEVFSGREK